MKKNVANMNRRSGSAVIIPASVANHRYDALFTHSVNTDLMQSSVQSWEMFGWKHNLKLTCFTADILQDNAVILDGEAGGRMRAELYHRTDLSTSLAQIQAELNWFESVYGRKPSALAYRNGNETNAPIIQANNLVFMGRNSSAVLDRSAPGENFYGTGLGTPDTPVSNAWVNRPSTYRYWESGRDVSLPYMTDQLNLAKVNFGWFNHFYHALDGQTGNDLDAPNRFMGNSNSVIGSDFVWRTSMGEAAEYAFLRNSITSVTAININNTVEINLTKNTIPNFNLISVPVSVKIDTTGTPLQGQEITSTGVGIRKISANVFIVDIAKGLDGQPMSVTVSATGTPSYYDFDLPSIVSENLVGSDWTITTDKPTKLTTWLSNRNASEETALLHKRSTTLQTSHTITLDPGDAAKDLRVSVITAEEQSILSNPYQLA